MKPRPTYPTATPRPVAIPKRIQLPKVITHLALRIIGTAPASSTTTTQA